MNPNDKVWWSRRLVKRHFFSLKRALSRRYASNGTRYTKGVCLDKEPCSDYTKGVCRYTLRLYVCALWSDTNTAVLSPSLKVWFAIRESQNLSRIHVAWKNSTRKFIRGLKCTDPFPDSPDDLAEFFRKKRSTHTFRLPVLHKHGRLFHIFAYWGIFTASKMALQYANEILFHQ